MGASLSLQLQNTIQELSEPHTTQSSFKDYHNEPNSSITKEPSGKVDKDNVMPWFEPKNRVGTAGKRRPLDRVAPQPVWPGLDHNGRPVEEPAEEVKKDDSSKNESSNNAEKEGPSSAKDEERIRPAIPPLRPRSRKRKKNAGATWKEIIDEGSKKNAQVPRDLQVGDNDAKRVKVGDGEGEAACNPDANEQTPSPNEAPSLPRTTAEIPFGNEVDGNAEADALTGTDNSDLVPAVASRQSLKHLLEHLPGMVKAISNIHSMLGKLVTSGVPGLNSGEKCDHSSQSAVVLDRQEAIVARMESLATRQEKSDKNNMGSLHKRIQELEEQCKKQEEQIVYLKESSPKKDGNQLPPKKEKEFEKKVQRLEEEARERNKIIAELQRLQEKERRDSQKRVTEALQRIEQLQSQNEKFQRRNAKLQALRDENANLRSNLLTSSKDHESAWPSRITMSKNVNNTTDRPDGEDRTRSIKAKKRLGSLDGSFARQQASRSKVSKHPPTIDLDSSVSSNSFGTPTNRGDEASEVQSEDSPFSTGSSRKGANRRPRHRIVPGKCFQYKKSNHRSDTSSLGRPSQQGARRASPGKSNLRDLIPNYALDSLARPRST